MLLISKRQTVRTINKRSRQSNFELLRILAMIMIVISHYISYSGVANGSLPIGINRLFLEIMNIGKIGAVLFMLIMGYFLSGSRHLEISKVIKLITQVLFYSIMCYAIALVFLGEQLSFGGITKAFFPITFKTYWFITAYIVVYLFHPFINALTSNLNRKQYKQLLILMVVLFLGIKTLTHQDMYVGEIGAFFLYYIFGSYLSVYKDNIFASRKNRVLIMAISWLMILVSTIIFDLIGSWKGISMLSDRSNILLISNGSIVVFAISACIFCAIGYARPFYNKYINAIAAVSFGIYLIHDNYLVRKIIWQEIFRNAEFINTPLLVPHILASVFVVFVVCGLIEYIRKNTLESYYVLVISPKIDAIQQKLNKYIK